MHRIVSEGAIYKVHRYSDNSAIGYCFFREFGKLKLFIPKMFSSKGGVTKILPGEIDFLKKEHSDLNKFYGIRYNTSKMFFVEDVSIFLRLNLIFAVFDVLYPEGEADGELYNLIMCVDSKNLKRAGIYILSYMLKNQGFFPQVNSCGVCGETIKTTLGLSEMEIVCDKCLEEKDFCLNLRQTEIFLSIFSREKFRNLDISDEDELKVLLFIVKYTEKITGRKINGNNYLLTI